MDKQYIKIKIFTLGETASRIATKPSLCHDLEMYHFTHEEDVQDIYLKYIISNADIIFVIADLADVFAAETIVQVVDALLNHKKRFISILSAPNDFKNPLNGIAENLRHKSSVLVVEDQNDISINAGETIIEKFETIIDSLCYLIDEEIVEMRALEDTFSSLIFLERFFDQKCELYLYSNLTEKQVKEELERRSKFRRLLEQANQVWIKCSVVQGKVSIYKTNDKIYDFAELIEMTLDEDANFIVSPCSLSSEMNFDRKIEKIIATVLIDISVNHKTHT
jgi:hypothetical protein